MRTHFFQKRKPRSAGKASKSFQGTFPQVSQIISNLVQFFYAAAKKDPLSRLTLVKASARISNVHYRGGTKKK